MEFSGSLAFGAFAIGENALDEVRTPEYDDYQTLRLGRIMSKVREMGIDEQFDFENLLEMMSNPATSPQRHMVIPLCNAILIKWLSHCLWQHSLHKVGTQNQTCRP